MAVRDSILKGREMEVFNSIIHISNSLHLPRCKCFIYLIILQCSIIFIFITNIIHISDTGEKCHAKEGNTMANITKITRVSQESRQVYQEVHQQYLSQHTPVVTGRLYVRPRNRLGNNLFQMASTYGIAKKTGKIPVLSKSFLSVDQLFPNVWKYFDFGEPGKNIAEITEIGHAIMDSELLTLGQGNYLVCCYMQSWKYFDGFSEDVRDMFQFEPSLIEMADNYLKMLYKYEMIEGHSLTFVDGGHSMTFVGEGHSVTFVGVHVRRGDTTAMNSINDGYITPTLVYIHHAMNYFRKSFKNVLFVVTSDDLDWCRTNLKYRDVHIPKDGRDRFADLVLLSQCNHTIMTVGTFGWWAGWLAGGTVLHFSQPARQGSNYRNGFNDNFTDFFPANWISMRQPEYVYKTLHAYNS